MQHAVHEMGRGGSPERMPKTHLSWTAAAVIVPCRQMQSPRAKAVFGENYIVAFFRIL